MVMTNDDDDDYDDDGVDEHDDDDDDDDDDGVVVVRNDNQNGPKGGNGRRNSCSCPASGTEGAHSRQRAADAGGPQCMGRHLTSSMYRVDDLRGADGLDRLDITLQTNI